MISATVGLVVLVVLGQELPRLMGRMEHQGRPVVVLGRMVAAEQVEEPFPMLVWEALVVSGIVVMVLLFRLQVVQESVLVEVVATGDRLALGLPLEMEHLVQMVRYLLLTPVHQSLRSLSIQRPAGVSGGCLDESQGG
jgi:hypothetical protein